MLPNLYCLYSFNSVSHCQGFSQLRQQFPSLPPCKGENGEAAVSSPILAAFASQRRHFTQFPPILMAQNSQYGGCSRASRHSLRRQFSQLCQMRSTTPAKPVLPTQLVNLAGS